MQKIHLNFSQKPYIKASVWAWLLLALALGLLLLIRQQYIASRAAIESLHESLPAINLKPVISDALLDEKRNMAQQTHLQLNTPWIPMLAALETVKLNNPNITFLSIKPSKNRADIQLKGEAESFNDITQLLNDLRKQPAFRDAALLNQHLEQDKSQLFLVFEIHIAWQL